MAMSRRAKRMERHHRRAGKACVINLVSLMDIFTILVFFLLVNSSAGEVLPTLKAVELPESVAERRPHETVVVMVTTRHVLVQGKVVASVQALVEEQDAIYAPLRRALLNQLEHMLHEEEDAAPANREATIMGERKIPYRVLKKIMATCTASGYGRISLAVLQKPLQEG
jgi:biopolymer transport protein ExbD